MFTFTVFDQISVTNYNSFESMFINLCISQAKSVNIGVIYRPPHLSTSEFITDFNEMVGSCDYCSKTCYILGDLNINLMNVENDNQCADFMNVLYSYSLLPTIDIPTRISSTSATLIDNVITNDSNPMNSAVITFDISDHLPICLVTSTTIDNNSCRSYTYKRCMSDGNIERLRSHLRQIDWSCLSGTDVNYAYDTFVKLFSEAFDHFCPLKKISLSKKKSFTPWISNSILKSIRKKNKLYRSFLSHPS